MSWFRMYTEMMDDPKVMQLDPKEFRAWVVCLCLAKEGNAGYGVIPDESVVAFKLHCSKVAAWKYMETLRDKGLIDVSEEGVSTPHNWSGRQYDSDVSTTRVQRFRNKQKVVSGNGNETFQKPPQSTEYRVQSTETPLPPHSPIDTWTEKLCDKHPSPSDPRYPATFCSDHWHRMGEDAGTFEHFMGEVFLGLVSWCAHWELDGNRFAISLDKWLTGEGWKKKAPKVVEKERRKTLMELVEEQEASKHAH